MKDLKGSLLKALDLDRQGSWDEAHGIVQKMEHEYAHWIHAYLHREEGDLSNSSYWYRRAGREMPEVELEEEWQSLHDFMEQISES